MCVCWSTGVCDAMQCDAVGRAAPVFKLSWSAAVTVVLVVVIDCAFPGFLGGSSAPCLLGVGSVYAFTLPGLLFRLKRKCLKNTYLPASPDSSGTENYGLMIDYSGLIQVQTKQMAS